MTPNRIIALTGICILFLMSLIGSSRLFENLDAEHIMVIQDPMDGEFHWYADPGLRWQGFGKVTKYPRRAIYSFDQISETGIPTNGKAVQFNDGGHATLAGSIQYEYPVGDMKQMLEIHRNYASPEERRVGKECLTQCRSRWSPYH